jgi:hypothetical protein
MVVAYGLCIRTPFGADGSGGENACVLVRRVKCVFIHW